MKKEDVSGFIVYILILIIAIVYGLTYLKDHAGASNAASEGIYAVYILGSIVTGVVFNALLFEFGHILGAKVGGYEILSINILGFCFYKEESKRKFRFASFDGLTGETKICPKKQDKEPTPYPFLLLGSLFFAVEIVLVMVLFSIFKNGDSISSDIAYFILTIGVIGLMILLYNIIPLKLDTLTDGYRLTLVTNPKNKEAFNELLRVEHEIALGHENVEVKTFTEITNFTSELNLNKIYILLEHGNFAEAEEMLNITINNKDKISEKIYLRAKAQVIYINLLTKSLDEAKEYYKNNVSQKEIREISTDVSMASIRAYMLISGLLDKSRSECYLALNRVLKAYKSTNKNRQKIEMKLFNDCLDKVIEVHPDWELGDYRLVEKEVKEKKD